MLTLPLTVEKKYNTMNNLNITSTEAVFCSGNIGKCVEGKMETKYNTAHRIEQQVEHRVLCHNIRNRLNTQNTNYNILAFLCFLFLWFLLYRSLGSSQLFPSPRGRMYFVCECPSSPRYAKNVKLDQRNASASLSLL